MNLGPMELGIILLIAILLFGGTRLAGVGKASGRAIREFKEETADLKKPQAVTPSTPVAPAAQVTPVPPVATTPVVDGEVVGTERFTDANGTYVEVQKLVGGRVVEVTKRYEV